MKTYTLLSLAALLLARPVGAQTTPTVIPTPVADPLVDPVWHKSL